MRARMPNESHIKPARGKYGVKSVKVSADVYLDEKN